MISPMLLSSALAMTCAIFGFTGIAGAMAWLPQAMFVLFVGITLVSLAVGLLGRARRQAGTPF